MPFLSVGNNAQLFYEDSGPLETNDYTTLVLVHGIIYHGGIFKRFFPLAAKHNFRFVSLYRRDYPPSTPLSQDDYKQQRGEPDEQISYYRNRGVEIGNFVDQFIIDSDIPLPVGNRGGVVLVGWSLGTSFVHAFLSSFDSLSPKVTDNLSKYLHSVIQFDPPPGAFGFGNPPGWIQGSIWAQQDLNQRLTIFNQVVGSYYVHESVISGDATTLNLANPVAGQQSFQSMSPEELGKLINLAALTGPDVIMNRPEVINEINRRAYCDGTMAELLPNLRIRYFHGKHSSAVFVWGLWELKKRLLPSAARDVEIVPCETGNHFMIWEEPEAALEQFRRCIDI